MIKKFLTPRALCISAVIAALYTVLTVAFAPISYGNIQCRISEAMTVLPLLMPEAIPGLFVGCLLSNLLAPTPFLPDIIFGSLTTLAAAVITYQLRGKKAYLAFLPPVILNGIVVGIIVNIFYVPEVPVLICMAEVAAGEAVAVFVLGWALLAALKKIDIQKLLRVQ